MKKNNIVITDVIVYEWIIPMYGNNHISPYGTLQVWGKVNGKVTMQNCKILGGVIGNYKQYVIFNKQRYKIINKGTLYSPKIELEIWEKEKIGNRWMYV